METQAVVVPEQQIPEQPAEKRLTVFARNPQEMNVAQGQLIKWTLAKMGEIRGEINDLQENLAIAVKNGWRTVTLKRQIGRANGRQEFYRKVKAALEAGYCIIPNFPIDVFAVRTEKNTPDRHTTRGQWNPQPADQTSEAPALGDGKYVSPRQMVRSRDVILREDDKHQPIHGTESWASDFMEVDFPFALAQPAVLNATQQAMADRLFDELGVSPTRAVRRGDPMVIGRIYTKWDRSKALSFVVAWFLRPDRDLDF